MDIILASSSPYRKELLSRLGIKFQCLAPDFSESEIKAQKDLSVVEKAERLAIGKAKSLQNQASKAIIIGSDQICHFEDQIFSKTGDIDKSFDLLRFLSGKSHQLTTSYCVLYPNGIITHTNKTILKMRKLSDIQIKNYLRADNPIDCAGSYKLELKGISLFESIKTEDHTAIIGLPLIQLGSDLESLGVNLLE